MTDRDHFAAAALTGLLAGRKFTALDDAIVAEAYAEAAYGIADAMLRERCRAGADCPVPDNAPNHDAAVDTPKPHATRGEGSEQRECTEPVAWAVCTPGDGNWSPCFFHEPHAQRHASAILGSKNIVPLYRQPPCQDFSQKKLTLTDCERGAIERAVDSIASTMPYESQQGLADWKTLRGLLRRLGGAK